MSEQDKTETEIDELERDPQVDGGAAEAADSDEPAARIAELEDKLARTERALAEADLRAQAEIQNIRRRAERDVSNAHRFAVEKFAADMLPVADALERALASLDPQDEALKTAREGSELTLKALLDVFTRFNIEPVNPHGEAFNPELHEAMAMVPQPDAEPNSVIDVLEKGYTLNGRLLRPAKVAVAKAE